MSGEDPQLEQPPPTTTTAQAPAPAPGGGYGRVILIAAVVIGLGLGAYFVARSGLLGAKQDSAFVVQPFTPPQPLASARERVLAHAQPDESSRVVVMLGQGAALDVTGRVSRGLGNDWYQIRWNDQTAYVRQQDAAPGEAPPPGVPEREAPQETEEKPPPDEPDDVDVGEFPEAAASDLSLSDVRWLREPNARDFARFYPHRALDQGRSGRVVLDCVASPSGALDCSVVEEHPVGWGFGEAALSIARQARLAPTANDGSSVAGRHVRLPLAFRAG